MHTHKGGAWSCSPLRSNKLLTSHLEALPSPAVPRERFIARLTHTMSARRAPAADALPTV